MTEENNTMLRIGVIDDELKDLLASISNLVALDPEGVRIDIVPCLLSSDSEVSVRLEEDRTKSILKAVLATKGVTKFQFPSIELLGPLNTTNDGDAETILAFLANRKTALIISDSWMQDQAAGIILLEKALSDPRWSSIGWQCWLATKHDRVAKVILDTRGQTRKFDPYAHYLNKTEIIKAARQCNCAPELERIVETTISQVEAAEKVKGLTAFGSLIGQSPMMRRVYELIEAYSKNPRPILITGESGTGKGLVARQIHDCSGRTGQYVILNSAGMEGGLVESELFGHERGAFTGANAQKKGKFEFAKKGTFFFDEIGDMPLITQSKLLTAIEERRFYRVGGNEEVKVDDVRIIAATDQPLIEMLDAGSFRRQLYYRLAILQIPLPPLRDRTEDIPLLINAFVREINERDGRCVKISQAVISKLQTYDWPGNVRELKNCLEQAFVSTELAQRDEITVDDIQLDINPRKASSKASVSSAEEVTLDEAERDWNRMREGQLMRSLVDEQKILGEGRFPDFLRLLLDWLDDHYGDRLPPENVIQKMFGVNKNNFKVRLHEYQKKYGLRRRNS
jgi:DNA-binding NtrC family response regulator